MTTQSEQQLENNLIARKCLGFTPVTISGNAELESNLKTQLEKFNGTTFSDREFERILNHLNKGNTFEKPRNCVIAFLLGAMTETSFPCDFSIWKSGVKISIR